MKPWQKITLAGCGGCLLVAIAAVAGAVFFAFQAVKSFQQDFENPSPRAWEECPVPHPALMPAITFRQRGIHPFLAEFEYRVRFDDGTNVIDGRLPINVGGRTKMNAYWYPQEEAFPAAIRLQDHWGEYVVRPAEMKTYSLLRRKGRLYIGEVQDENSGYSISEREGAPLEVTLNGSEALDVTDSPLGSGSGSYIGRIDGTTVPLRFVPAEEAPEQKIEGLR